MAGLALAANETAPRAYAPVQKGFDAQGEMTLPYAPDRILVQFRDVAIDKAATQVPMVMGAQVPDARTGYASIDALARAHGVVSVERPYVMPSNGEKAANFGRDRWFMYRFQTEHDMVQVAEDFRADPNVAAVSLDWRAFPEAVPNDPIYPDHWGHNNTSQMVSYDWSTHTHTGPTVGTPGFDASAQAAWDQSQGYGSSAVVIAIIDSGVDIDHPDLRLVAGYDYGDNDSNPDDNSVSAGHGTACAGVAAAMANNNLGIVGIAGGASVMPLKVMNSAGSMYLSSIQNAIYHAADNGADIASMSLSADISSDAATDAALQYAYNAGVLLLAASSNYNENHIRYPANNQYVMGIGAASPCGGRKRAAASTLYTNPGVDPDPNDYSCDGERWWGSNYGVTTPDAGGAVDVIAPTILPTTDIGGSAGYASGDYSWTFNGTSCATPYAAGVAALVKSANPTYTPAQIRDAIVNGADDVVNVESGVGWDRYSGYGLINADAALGGGGPVAPTADFAGSPTSGQYPLTVNFTDLSAGAPTSWSWTFGDGGTSTSQNPSHTYTSAGTYNVSLSVSNAQGSDSKTVNGYITVTPPPAPTAAFSGAPTSGSYPLDVTFTDESSGSPTSWSWTFGDGGTSTAQNPSHTYTAVGSYDVTLTATNAQGSDVLTKTGYITVTEPGVTTYITADGEISVTGTVSGSYVNTKTSDGVNEVITEEAYTGHPRKTYSYAEHQWTFDLPGGDTTFLLEASRDNNSEGDNFQFAYTTDGVNYVNVALVSSATEQSFSVPLGNVSGSVTVRAVDTNRSFGNTANDALYVDYIAFEVGDVQPVAPTADFAGTPTNGVYPLTVNFSDASSGDPISWSWTFGDGGTSTAQNPSHTYTAAGTYTVSLTATNAQGSDTATKTNYITVTEPGQGATTMYVSDMAVSRGKTGPNSYGACDITVADDQGDPVDGAVVYVTFDGPTNGTTSGTTAADGTVTLQSTTFKRPSGEWCFEVTNITHGTLSYDPGSNVTTRSCEGGDVNSFGYEGAMSYVNKLDQNSPNPFNPITEIKFNLAKSSQVALKVYNVRGQVVETLASGVHGAGQHRVSWDARQHPSGVYFYRLETPDYSETRKMIMLK
jgi:PKD repeat protein